MMAGVTDEKKRQTTDSSPSLYACDSTPSNTHKAKAAPLRDLLSAASQENHRADEAFEKSNFLSDISGLIFGSCVGTPSYPWKGFVIWQGLCPLWNVYLTPMIQEFFFIETCVEELLKKTGQNVEI